jgi:opacity protein-like surface antigen
MTISRFASSTGVLPRFLVAMALAATWTSPAAADEPAKANAECPPGSWFCSTVPAGPSAASQTTSTSTSTTTTTTTTTTATTAAAAPAPAPMPPPQSPAAAPPAPIVVVGPTGEIPKPYEYEPRDADYIRRREWGLNMRIFGALLGSKAPSNARMGGAGVGLRFRLAPGFALTTDLDFAGGRDFNSNMRSETALTFNAMAFLNSQSRVQVYVLGGLGVAQARVEDSIAARNYKFSYVGLQGGAGLEIRLSRHLALDFDGRAILRGRSDDARDSIPEYRDENGRTTNTSGAITVNGGLMFYF